LFKLLTIDSGNSKAGAIPTLFDFQGITIRWLGHDGFLIKNGKTVVVDPFKLRSVPGKADILLISHEHFDHMSIEDIKKVISEKTVLVSCLSCKEELSKIKFAKTKFLQPGESVILDNVTIEAVPAYNINKFREPGKPFHPKEDGKLGFVLQFEGVRIYHAGDTDFVPEMRDLKPDIALLPVSGTYVMTAAEAASAARSISPKLAIPMHYSSIVGSERDALEFKRLAPCEVQILKPE